MGHCEFLEQKFTMTHVSCNCVAPQLLQAAAGDEEF